MEQKNRIKNAWKVLRAFGEVADATILGLVAKENVLITGPPGTAKVSFVQVLSKVLQAKLARHVDQLPSDIMFVEVNNASSLRLIEEGSAKSWIVVAATSDEMSDSEALYNMFTIKVPMLHLDDRDLFSALMAVHSDVVLASMDDVKTLNEHIKMTVKDVIKPYYDYAVPLIKTLRKKGIFLSDEYIIGRLPRLYATYLVLHASEDIAPEDLINAAYNTIMYVIHPEKRHEAEAVIYKEYDIIGLALLLEDGKKMLETDAKNAIEVFREVAEYDISHLPHNQKQIAEKLIDRAKEYIKKIQELKSPGLE